MERGSVGVYNMNVGAGNTGDDFPVGERGGDSLNKLQKLTTMMSAEERDYNSLTKNLQLKKKEILRQQGKFKAEHKERKGNAEKLKILKDETEQLHLKLSAQILSVRELKSKYGQGVVSTEAKKDSPAMNSMVTTAFRNLSTLEGAFEEDESAISALKEEVEKGHYSGEMQRLNSEISEEVTLIQQYETSLQMAKQGQMALLEEKSHLDEDRERLERDKKELLSAVSSTQDELQKRVDEHGLLSSLLKNSAVVLSDIQALLSRQDTLRTNSTDKATLLSELSNTSVDLEKRLVSLEDQETSLDLSIHAINDAITKQKGVISGLESTLAEIATKKEAEERKRDSLTQELQHLAAAMEDQLKSREKVQKTVTKFRQQLHALTETETEDEEKGQGPGPGPGGGADDAMDVTSADDDSLESAGTGTGTASGIQAPSSAADDRNTWQSLALIEADVARSRAAQHECERTHYALLTREADCERLLGSELLQRAAALREETARQKDTNAATQSAVDDVQACVYSSPNSTPGIPGPVSHRLLHLLTEGGSEAEESKHGVEGEGEDEERACAAMAALLGYHIDTAMLAPPSTAGTGGSTGSGGDDGDASALVAATSSLLSGLLQRRIEFRSLQGRMHSLQEAIAAKSRTVSSTASAIQAKEQAFTAALLSAARNAPEIKDTQRAQRTALALLDSAIKEEDVRFRSRFAQMDADFKAQDGAFEADYRSKIKVIKGLKLDSILKKNYAGAGTG